MSADAEMVPLPIELCLSQYSQYNGYVTNVILLSPIPRPNLLLHWNATLWQRSSPDVVRNCSFVRTLHESDLVSGWETWFSVEKTWQPCHTNTFYLSSCDTFDRLDERVKRCSQRKQEFWYEGKCTSVLQHYPISLHLSSKKLAGAQRIATYYFLYKVKGMHNIQFMFDSS